VVLGTQFYIHFNDGGSSRSESELQRRFTMLITLIHMIQRCREYQRNLAELSKLNDRELADIGLSRSDILRVAAGN